MEFINELTNQVEVFEPNNKIVLMSSYPQALILIKSNEFIGPCVEFLSRKDDSLVRVLPDYRINITNSMYLLRNPYKDSSIMDIFINFLKKKFSDIRSKG